MLHRKNWSGSRPLWILWAGKPAWTRFTDASDTVWNTDPTSHTSVWARRLSHRVCWRTRAWCSCGTVSMSMPACHSLATMSTVPGQLTHLSCSSSLPYPCKVAKSTARTTHRRSSTLALVTTPPTCTVNLSTRLCRGGLANFECTQHSARCTPQQITPGLAMSVKFGRSPWTFILFGLLRLPV